VAAVPVRILKADMSHCMRIHARGFRNNALVLAMIQAYRQLLKHLNVK